MEHSVRGESCAFGGEKGFTHARNVLRAHEKKKGGEKLVAPAEGEGAIRRGRGRSFRKKS